MSTGSSFRKPSRVKAEGDMTLAGFLWSSLLCGFGFGILSSLILFYGLAYIAGFPVLLRDTLVIQVYLILLSVFTHTVFACFLWLPGKGIHSLLRKRQKETAPVIVYTVLFSISTMLWFLLFIWILIDRPFDFKTPWFFPALLLFCMTGIAVGILLKDTVLSIKRSFKRADRVKTVKLVFLILCASIIIPVLTHLIVDLRSGGRGVAVTPALREPADTKLVVIGLDGATWDIMDGMIERGELPNIKFLMDNGSYGHLTSYISKLKAFTNSASMGMRSPALWESIATGKNERKHGIFDFTVMHFPFMKSVLPFRLPLLDDFVQTTLTTSTVGKSCRVWDILSRSGLEVGVIGWWNQWPVTPVDNGYVISSRIKWNIDGSVYPPDLLDGYPRDRSFTEGRSMIMFLNPWEGLEGDSLATLIKTSSARSNYESFKKHFTRDDFMAALSVHMMRNHPTPLFLTYFWGPDFVCHLFWKYMEELYSGGSNYSDVRDEDARLFGDIIYHYYAFLDDVVGKHVEVDSLDATYLIVSDHGFGRWGGEGDSPLELSGRLYHPSYSGKHEQNGIIIMAGKNVKRGVILDDARIFDVTPTILALFGMPVALDMDGRVLVEAIEEDFLETHPLRYVNTYETGEERIPTAVPSKVDDQIKERLRALGYID
ncbi:MAG: alkaline phosphatase family protein [Candidatus Glassbacteria bacterium]